MITLKQFIGLLTISLINTSVSKETDTKSIRDHLINYFTDLVRYYFPDNRPDELFLPAPSSYKAPYREIPSPSPVLQELADELIQNEEKIVVIGKFVWIWLLSSLQRKASGANHPELGPLLILNDMKKLVLLRTHPEQRITAILLIGTLVFQSVIQKNYRTSGSLIIAANLISTLTVQHLERKADEEQFKTEFEKKSWRGGSTKPYPVIRTGSGNLISISHDQTGFYVEHINFKKLQYSQVIAINDRLNEFHRISQLNNLL